MNCEAVAIGFGFCFGAVRGPRVKMGRRRGCTDAGGDEGCMHGYLIDKAMLHFILR